MLRKLQLQFVVLSMTLVTMLLAVIVGAMFLSARENLERISGDVLRRVIHEPSKKKSAPSIGGGDVSLPYFTVSVYGREAYLTGGTYAELENTELLETILNDCLSYPEPEGSLPAYGLRYLREDSGWHKRVAFVDMSMEKESLRKMLRSQLAIAFLALIPLFAMSVWLSERAVAPVEKAWRQQRQFLSDASHELKTPLTVILSNADLLEASRLPDRPRRWVENIQAESRRMKTLVEEMLTLARADNAAPSGTFGEVALSEIALDCALSFEPVAFEAGKPLRYEIAPGVIVSGDAEKLRRLASVLLDNALKYGADGGAASLTLEKSERQAKLTVSNPGAPIPPETLSRLFERFYRGDASRGETGGFGLGLSIAESIAKEHKGTLKAESDSESTRFIFTVPIVKRSAPPSEANITPPENKISSGLQTAPDAEITRSPDGKTAPDLQITRSPDDAPRLPENGSEQAPDGNQKGPES